MPKTPKADSKEIIDSITENYKAFKRPIRIILIVFVSIATILFILAKSQQENTPAWVYWIFFAVMIGILLRRFIPKLFPKEDPRSAWDKCKSIFLSKNFTVVLGRIAMLIIFVFVMVKFFWNPFQKREIVYVDTNPPVVQTVAPTQPSPSYTASPETMTYNANQRYYLNVSHKDIILDLNPINTNEAYVTVYHYNTNDVAMKLHIFLSGKRMITDPLYRDGSSWVGEYHLVFDREVVIQKEK